jgi:hypothetical protein
MSRSQVDLQETIMAENNDLKKTKPYPRPFQPNQPNQPKNSRSANSDNPVEEDPAVERGERIATSKMIARSGKDQGDVPGATPQKP